MPFFISTDPRPAADAIILMAGQSLITNALQTDGAANLVNTLISKAVSMGLNGTAVKQVDLIDVSVGNSYEDRFNLQSSSPGSGHYWFDPALIDSPAVSGATNGTTSSSSAVLHFASTPAGVAVGHLVTNSTTPASITSPTYVQSFDGTTVTMTNNAHSTVGSGDTILFSPYGPLLITALAFVADLDVPPNIIVFDGGESDAIYAAITGLSTDPGIATRFIDALNGIFAALRAACNPGSPTDVPVYLFPVGRIQPADGPFPGREIIRQAQLTCIADGTNVYGLELANYDLALDSQYHYEYAEMGRYGNRLGDLIAKNSYAATGIKLGPVVASVVMGLTNRVDVAITVESGDVLVKPSAPWGVYVEDSAAPGIAVPINHYNWSGNTLQMTLANDILGSPVFKTMYDWGANFITITSEASVSNYDNIIKGSVSDKPLRYWRS